MKAVCHKFLRSLEDVLQLLVIWRGTVQKQGYPLCKLGGYFGTKIFDFFFLILHKDMHGGTL